MSLQRPTCERGADRGRCVSAALPCLWLCKTKANASALFSLPIEAREDRRRGDLRRLAQTVSEYYSLSWARFYPHEKDPTIGADGRIKILLNILKGADRGRDAIPRFSGRVGEHFLPRWLWQYLFASVHSFTYTKPDYNLANKYICTSTRPQADSRANTYTHTHTNPDTRPHTDGDANGLTICACQSEGGLSWLCVSATRDGCARHFAPLLARGQR